MKTESKGNEAFEFPPFYARTVANTRERGNKTTNQSVLWTRKTGEECRLSRRQWEQRRIQDGEQQQRCAVYRRYLQEWLRAVKCKTADPSLSKESNPTLFSLDHNYTSFSITTHHSPSLPINRHHYPSFTITSHHSLLLSLAIIHYYYTSFPSFTITTHQSPSLAIIHHLYTSFAITSHHSPSLPIIRHHYPSFAITTHHSPSLPIIRHH